MGYGATTWSVRPPHNWGTRWGAVRSQLTDFPARGADTGNEREERAGWQTARRWERLNEGHGKGQRKLAVRRGMEVPRR